MEMAERTVVTAMAQKTDGYAGVKSDEASETADTSVSNRGRLPSVGL
jgi:hypothetical protein